MTKQDIVDLIIWANQQKTEALTYEKVYEKRQDMRMAQAYSYKAVAYNELIDHLTRIRPNESHS